jgi:phage gpG-like protein
MDRTFKNVEQFTTYARNHLNFSKKNIDIAMKAGLTAAAEYLTIKAKEKFGHYQAGWKELADATKADRVSKGWTPNDPLLRDGSLLRKSVKFSVYAQERQAFIGSNEVIMCYQEFGAHGTGKGRKGTLPPRPVFLITLHVDGAESVSVFFKAFIETLRG